MDTFRSKNAGYTTQRHENFSHRLTSQGEPLQRTNQTPPTQDIYLRPPRLTLGNSRGTRRRAIRRAAASAFPPLIFHLLNSDSRGLSIRQPNSRKYCWIVFESRRRSSRRSEGSVASSFGELPPRELEPPSLAGCGGMWKVRAQMVVWRRVRSCLERKPP